MILPAQPYKGARDFYPEDKRLQKWIFSVWRSVVESYGYEEYDAPMLEPTELYVSKTSDEIVNEQTYTFVDRGGRSVTMRTEMTPSVSRMVAARRQELSYPLRLYSIPNLWRYERPQRGRLREFWQLNVDVFGIDNIAADFEIIQISDAIMKAFGAKPSMYTLKINSRKLINSLFEEYLGLDKIQTKTFIYLIDKMHKIEHSQFVAKLDALLAPGQREEGFVDKMLNLLNIKDIKQLPAPLSSHPSVESLRKLNALCFDNSIGNVQFDISLMRGFDYYTDIVFEIYDTHPDNNRSMFGGGRYDGLVAQFGVEPVPTVGFGMGDATLYNFLVLHQLIPRLKPETDVYVVLIGNVYHKAQRQLQALRKMGVNVAVDTSNRKIDKQLRSAYKKNIRYVLFIGEDELQNNQFTLKDLTTGKEEVHSLERLVSIIKDYRHS